MATIDNINDQMLNATEFVINYSYFYKVGNLNNSISRKYWIYAQLIVIPIRPLDKKKTDGFWNDYTSNIESKWTAIEKLYSLVTHPTTIGFELFWPSFSFIFI